jgi:hypothetical protein
LSVNPYDEPKIGNRDVIIRRINPDQHVIWDENRQVWRISSKAYNKSSGTMEGMSYPSGSGRLSLFLELKQVSDVVT